MLKVFAHEIFRVVQMVILFLTVWKTLWEKKTRGWVPAFSLFPAMGLKHLFLRVVKIWHCAVKGEC